MFALMHLYALHAFVHAVTDYNLWEPTEDKSDLIGLPWEMKRDNQGMLLFTFLCRIEGRVHAAANVFGATQMQKES